METEEMSLQTPYISWYWGVAIMLLKKGDTPPSLFSIKVLDEAMVARLSRYLHQKKGAG